MRLLRTVGAFHWMPSWLTYTQAGVSGSYCSGTYTLHSRQVPGNILELEKVNFSISPFGTPGCSTEAESTGYFSAGGAPWAKESAGARARFRPRISAGRNSFFMADSCYNEESQQNK